MVTDAFVRRALESDRKGLGWRSKAGHLAVDGAHGDGDPQDGVHVADVHIAVDRCAVPLQVCARWQGKD